jgi:glycosyltransferase involved in cell wall biosynthesis
MEEKWLYAHIAESVLMKVLLISKWIAGSLPGEFSYHGEWSRTFEFAKALADNGVEVVLVTPHPLSEHLARYRNEFGRILTEHRVRHYFANTPVALHFGGGSFRMRMLFKELEVLGKERPDIIQYMQFGPSLLYHLPNRAPIVFSSLHIPKTYVGREEDVEAKIHWSTRRVNVRVKLEDFAFRSLQKVLGASSLEVINRKSDALILWNRNSYEALKATLPYPDRIFFVPKGVSIEEARKWERYRDLESNRVLFVGIIYRRKGIFVLLEAFRKVNEEIADAELVVVGTGPKPMVDKMLALINDYDINASYIASVGYHQKWRYFQESAVFCLPSFHDAFVTVIIEAMACGIPVVTTEAVETRFDNGIAGFKVPAGDSDKLAEAIIVLLNDSKLRKEMGERAKNIAAQYDWIDIAKRFKDDIYERLVSR